MPVQLVAQLVQVDSLVEMPDVQLHEESAVSGSHPLLCCLPGVLDSAPRKIPAGMPVHLFCLQILNGEHGHPLNDMVLQSRNLNLPLLPAGYDVALLSRFMVPPVRVQLIDQADGIIVYFGRIQSPPRMIRAVARIPKYPFNNPILPFIQSAPVYGFCGGLNAAELFP